MNYLDTIKYPLNYFKEINKQPEYNTRKDANGFVKLRKDLDLITLDNHLFSKELLCYYYEFDNCNSFMLYMDDYQLTANLNFYKEGGIDMIKKYLTDNKDLCIKVTCNRVYKITIGETLKNIMYEKYNR